MVFVSPLTSSRLPRHFTRHGFDLFFEILQPLYHVTLKPNLTSISLPFDKTGDHFFHEPTKRTMLWNDLRI